MAFGKKESFNNEYLSYKESVDMLLNDLKSMGHKNLSKEKLIDILKSNFSIGRAVRMEICKIIESH
jgi:hypothetical protein